GRVQRLDRRIAEARPLGRSARALGRAAACGGTFHPAAVQRRLCPRAHWQRFRLTPAAGARRTGGLRAAGAVRAGHALALPGPPHRRRDRPPSVAARTRALSPVLAAENGSAGCRSRDRMAAFLCGQAAGTCRQHADARRLRLARGHPGFRSAVGGLRRAVAGAGHSRGAKRRADRVRRAVAGAGTDCRPPLTWSSAARLHRGDASLNLAAMKCDGRSSTGKQQSQGETGTMRKQIVRLTAVLLLAGCVAPAMAQDKPARIVLETKTGSVMTSDGGDYASVDAGKELAQGQSMMLGDGANATVSYYYDGQPKCTERYIGPNTYVIDDTCVRGVATTSPGKSAAIIAGT